MKTKQKKSPSLVERVEALKEEVDAELDRLAEECRPKGEGGAVPAGAIRQIWMARSNGNPFEALIIASKQNVIPAG